MICSMLGVYSHSTLQYGIVEYDIVECKQRDLTF